MDKYFHPFKSAGWKYLSSHKPPLMLGIDTEFHPTHYIEWIYVSMLGLNVIYVSKIGPGVLLFRKLTWELFNILHGLFDDKCYTFQSVPSKDNIGSLVELHHILLTVGKSLQSSNEAFIVKLI